jgi:hypothetical protein
VKKKVIKKKNDKVCINIVPGFPVLTTDTQLNYSKKMIQKEAATNSIILKFIKWLDLCGRNPIVGGVP